MKKIDIFLIIVGGLSLLGLTLFFIIQFKEDALLRGMLHEKKSELARAQTANLRLEDLKKRGENLQEKEKVLYAKVPLENDDLFGAIKTLTGVANNLGLRAVTFEIKNELSDQEQKSASGKIGNIFSLGVKLKSKFVPSEENIGAASPNEQESSIPSGPGEASTQEQGDKQPGEEFKSTAGPKRIYLEMNFESLLSPAFSFLKQVSKIDRLVTVEGIKIIREEAILPYQSFSLVLAVYVY
ncbi:MAG: hypothetical protein ABIH27_05830 [Candidatus Omnitrophota bacterium]